jgi:hypothetical protein
MKATIVIGTPKIGLSASGCIADFLERKLQNRMDCQTLNATSKSEHDITQKLSGANAIILIFPLYVDGLPSHVVKFLERLAPTISFLAPKAKLYAINNCGFWETDNTVNAFSILKNFCLRASLTWGQGLGIGGGGVIEMRSLEKWPLRKISKAIAEISDTIATVSQADDFFVQPSIPRFTYKIGAHFKWRSLASRNNIDSKTLYRRP